MSVKRYECGMTNAPTEYQSPTMHLDANGGYVSYEDYAALEARCAALAAENAGLLPKAASELSNAWVLHKYLIGIQAAIMYLDNGNKKAAQEWLYGTIAGPGFEFPDEVDDIEAWATHQMRGSISHPRALEIIKEQTPATAAFLAEVRASGIDQWIASRDGRWNGTTAEAERFAAQLRKGVQS